MSKSGTLQPLLAGLSERGDRPVVLALQKEGVENWTYAGLAEHTRRLAHGLLGAGVEPGDHVALLAPNGPPWICACLAVIGAGAVIVPLDVQLDDALLGYALEDSGASFIFTTRSHADRLESLDIEAMPKTILLDAGEDDARSWQRMLVEGHSELPEVEADAPAALFYTSGTTGTSKGVPLSHGNLAFQLDTLLEAEVVAEGDRILLPLPLHHVYPFTIGMLVPLALGLTIIFPHALTGPQIVRALNEGSATLVVGVPRLYSALYSAIEERSKSGGRVAATLFGTSVGMSTWLRRRLGLRLGKVLLRPLHQRFGPQLRVMASGGAALDPELAWNLEGLGWRVAIGYGLTETSPLLTLKPPEDDKLGSVGRPVPETDIRLDPSAVPEEESEGQNKARRSGAANEEGEILARGPGVFSGYRNLPEKTREVFTGDGWYRTGDLGYFDDDGYLYVTGRASTLIVTEGGKNVQPEDVEDAYLRSPVIEEIGVLQKDGRLVAVIVADQSEVKSRGSNVEEAVREAVRERSRELPSYRRLSDYAITRESLAYTRLGKLRRHLLEERFDRAKQGDEVAEEQSGPMPMEDMAAQDRDLIEDPAARRAWEWLAGRYPEERLTPDTSLQLDLGIDSMEWVNLTFEIGQSTGVDLDEEAIGRIDTVRDLLNEVAEADEGKPQVSPLEQPEEVLSDEQQRWLEPLSPVESTLARGMFALNRAIARAGFRLRVEGLEHLPEEGPYIIAPNHLSYLDAFAVAAALPYRRLRETYWAGWVGAAFGNPVFRLVSRMGQVMPVDPDRAVFSSLAFGAAALKEGKSLVWFPEGRRSPHGKLQEFKPGIGMLLNHFRVPVVPVVIRGTREAMPPGQALPRPHRVTVEFGEPLDARELECQGEGKESKDRIVQALREHISHSINKVK